MREKKNHLYVDSEERKLLLHSLVGLKNQLIQKGICPYCGEAITVERGFRIHTAMGADYDGQISNA